MNEIERLNPGLVVRSEHSATARTVAITGETAAKVLAEVARRQRRGEIESAGELQVIKGGPLHGHLVSRVVLIPRETVRPAGIPRWARTAALLLVAVSMPVAAMAWLLTAMSAASLAGCCVLLLVMLALIVLAGRKSGGRGGVTVISNIRVGR
jgi:hypothetical protein